MRFAMAFAVVAAGVCMGVAALVADDRTSLDDLRAFQNQLRTAAETAAPCVACVVVSRSELYPKPSTTTESPPGKLGEFDPTEFLKGKSSEDRLKLADRLDLAKERNIPDHTYVGGAVIDPSGLILTPYHAIEGATKIYVYLCTRDGKKVGSYADIFAADARSDLAVLKLIHPPEGLSAIAIADVQTVDRPGHRATIFPGKLVGLVAYPYTSEFMLGKPSVSYGGVTNVRHRIVSPYQGTNAESEKSAYPESFYKYGRLLEHDVRPNTALTGGVLIDLEGKMVGLTSATAVVYNREVGPGYAIPMDESVRTVLSALRKGEEVEYGFLGVTLMKGMSAVVIETMTPNGPAELAGLLPRDVITHINGFPIANYPDLLQYAGSALAGSRLKLTVRRDVPEKVYELTLGKYRNLQPFIASVRPEPVFGLRVDYLSVLAQQKNELPRSDRSGFPAALRGVSVREVIPGSPAATKFKDLSENPSNWLITQVNGTTVSTPAEFYAEARGQKSMKLTLREWSDPVRRELTLP
jgi:serine protease Do